MAEEQEQAGGAGRTIEYASGERRRDSRKVRRWLLRVGLGLAVGIIGFGVFVAVAKQRGKEEAYRGKCASNLKMIMMMSLIYSNDQADGAMPDSMVTLMREEDLTGWTMVCPGSNDTPVQEEAAGQKAAGLVTGGHLSYVYVGGRLTNRSPATAVVAFERPGNHEGGIWVVFADGRVQWVPFPAARGIVDQADAGVRPVMWPAGGPATAPVGGTR